MKPDFKEAAEKAFEKECESNMNFWLPREPEDEEVRYWKEIYVNGANHGYSEAMKEQREFRELVKEMIRRFELSGFMETQIDLSDGNAVNFAVYKSEIKKHLSSFTEQEQSTKEDNG
jgi:hypothetical protein